MPRLLGSAHATGVVTPTGQINAGNYTVTFSPALIGISAPLFDCYHIVISGPAGSGFTIYIGNRFYDNVFPGDANSWDPNQPMHLQNGDYLYFYWNTGSGTAPQVTLWFQEPSL
jgi:hypothetical protein